MVDSKPVFRAQVKGAGPTGALAALALARAGWQVCLSDPLPAVALLKRRLPESDSSMLATSVFDIADIPSGAMRWISNTDFRPG